jgi:hypothetical protein
MPGKKDDVVVHRHIAPRLASGQSRVPNAGALPEHIKRGLRLIAERENKSMSWVLEQIIYDYFGFTPPMFVGTRTAESINPEKHQTVVKKVSREKSARSKAALTKRGTTILDRAKRDQHAGAIH